jgi:competence protein ComEA
MGRTQAVAVGLTLAALLVGAGLGANRGGDSLAPAEETTTPVGSVVASPVFAVYVSGWVATPGVVEVEQGAIVADAIGAAGGALDGALLETINLARPLAAGDQVHIPGPGDPVSPGSGDPADGGLISPNRSEAAQLEQLPGVGPVLAERIVAHREANGPFETVEDLLDVPGIGEAKLSAIRDLIAVP